MNATYKIDPVLRRKNLALMLIPTCLTIAINIISRPSAGFVIVYVTFLLVTLVLGLLATGTERRIVVDDKSVTYSTLSSTTKLLIGDIEGHRIQGEVIRLIPFPQRAKPITIGHIFDFENSDEFVDWLWTNFKDLNAADLTSEEQLMLKNTNFGSTEDRRLKNLAAAKDNANGYNYNGFVLSFICLVMVIISFCASPSNRLNRFYTIFLLVYPLYGIYLTIKNKGLIRLVPTLKASIYPFIAGGFFLPCILLFINSLRFDTVGNSNWLLLGTIIASTLVFLMYYTVRDRIPRIAIAELFVFLLAASLYGFGAARQINYVFDPSSPIIYHAKVLKYREVFNRTNTYFLTLSPWGPQTIIKEIKVSEKTYNLSQIDSSVEVYCKAGLLNTPWFAVTSRR